MKPKTFKFEVAVIFLISVFSYTALAGSETAQDNLKQTVLKTTPVDDTPIETPDTSAIPEQSPPQKKKIKDDKPPPPEKPKSFWDKHQNTIIWILTGITLILLFCFVYIYARKKYAADQENTPFLTEHETGVQEKASFETKHGTLAEPGDMDSGRPLIMADPTAPVVICDSAIRQVNQDLLGTSRLVKSLSKFLRNENTQPPITLAVTGDWGSGKSSIMGMLRDDLEKYGYSPVWFNAWHHHQEKQMFGALMETIRQESIPRIWTISGLVFRARLMARRAWRHPLWLFLTVLLVIFLLSGGLQLKALHDSWQSVGKTPGFIGLIHFIFNGGILAGFFVSTSSLCIAIYRSFTAFGFKPVELIRTAERALKTINVDADPGIRYRINQALGDISWALGRHPLVIFIDDLDRCPPNKVLHILEAVNFLSSAPRHSFIVLGMALDKVLTTISLEFTPIVEETLVEHAGEPPENRRIRLKAERLKYAKNYLEKLINIEIHVPETNPEQMKCLTDREAKMPDYTDSHGSFVSRVARFADRRVFPVLVLFLFSLFIFLAGNKIETHNTSINRNGPGSDIQVQYNKTDWKKIQAIGLGWGIVLFLILIVKYAAEQKIKVSDSNEFKNALKIWTQSIMVNNHTPRHYKRSVNQLRLLSMRAAVEEEQRKTDTDGVEIKERHHSGILSIKFIVIKALNELGVDFDMLLSLVESGGYVETDSIVLKEQIEEKIGIGSTADASGSLHGARERIRILSEAMIEHQKAFKVSLWPEAEDKKLYDELIKGITLR